MPPLSPSQTLDSASPAALSPSRFAWVQRLLVERAGITLEAGKEYLVETRISPLAIQEGYASVDGFLHELSLGAGPRSASLTTNVVELLTTNETLFFRDLHPFEALRTEVLPQLIAARGPTRQLNVWSAACSTGQEPFSLAMLLADEFSQLDTWQVRILGTDLASHALEKARRASYQTFEVNRGLPAQKLIRHFRQLGNQWVLKDAIRRRVEFRPLNLIERWGPLPRFDLIFLRNVLIYFGVETRRAILQQVKEALAPDGYLILGNAETTVTLDPAFKPRSFGRATFFTLDQ